jgi:zinc/manganese transport system substrate-binding protein
MLRVRRTRRPLLAGAAALGLVLTACGAAEDDGGAAEDDGGAETAETGEATETEEATDDLLVVATTSILGDLTENLLADDGTVEVIMPPGADPHGFEPSAADAAMLREADLVIANGLQLEENLVSALESAEEDGVRVFELADKLDPIDFDWDGPHDHGHGEDGHEDEDEGHGHDGEDEGHGHEDEDEGHGHEDEDDGHGHEDEDEGPGHEDEDDGQGHGAEDPHFWHDPVRTADGVLLIADELAEVSEVVDAEEWETRAQGYADEILAAHEEIEETLAVIDDADRVLVTNHDAFGYLAVRYDFEVLGTVIPGSSTQAEANPREFSELIQTVEEAGVSTVFSENTESDRLAEQLASEVVDRSDLEIEVVQLYSDALGEDGSGAEAYLDMLRENAQRIADALG